MKSPLYMSTTGVATPKPVTSLEGSTLQKQPSLVEFLAPGWDRNCMEQIHDMTPIPNYKKNGQINC